MNSEKVKEATRRVFDKLNKMDSKTFKALLETYTEGNVYKSIKEVYDGWEGFASEANNKK